MARTSRLMLLAFVAGATVGCDQMTKHVASSLLAGTPDQSYFAGVLRLGYAENAGGFLSLGADLPPVARTVLFTVATGLALAGLVVLAIRKGAHGWPAIGLILFVSGGASNWLDRVATGTVVDFLNVGIGPLRTGIFNVADVAIMLGAAMYIVAEVRWRQAAKSSASQPGPPA